jgi:glycosyltransferase involved in cell wall biosynthesis
MRSGRLSGEERSKGGTMTEELISFVVPAYNEEALIASCLQAIVAETARTGHPAEIIVVNNNSTDRTREIALSIPGVTVIDEPQRGLVPARRAGCLAAKGRLIANIDADTMVPEGWLDTVLAEFARSPELVAQRPVRSLRRVENGADRGRGILSIRIYDLSFGPVRLPGRIDDAGRQLRRIEERVERRRRLQP